MPWEELSVQIIDPSSALSAGIASDPPNVMPSIE